MADLIYPELSYRLIGILYAVYNRLGGGYQEKYYQQAVRHELLTAGIPFLEQVKCNLFYQGKPLGRYYLDFIVDHTIVVELKAASSFSKRDIMQVLNYLKQSNLELGILASFSRNSIFYKRILRGRSPYPD
ncbi:MAG: GxxExxY protein [Candidatus Margulisbacteria bacterium]|jgi:GxxExxY protein|nr:GxxExxY protein [Candidatus Margulisiibacteriota bacterium]